MRGSAYLHTSMMTIVQKNAYIFMAPNMFRVRAIIVFPMTVVPGAQKTTIAPSVASMIVLLAYISEA